MHAVLFFVSKPERDGSVKWQRLSFGMLTLTLQTKETRVFGDCVHLSTYLILSSA